MTLLTSKVAESRKLEKTLKKIYRLAAAERLPNPLQVSAAELVTVLYSPECREFQAYLQSSKNTSQAANE
jgi:hypothetical protein